MSFESVDGSYATKLLRNQPPSVFRVSLFNERDVLRKKTTTKWVPQQSKTPENLFSNDERYRKNYKDGDGVSSEIADNVQKKITPWLETLKESDTQATSVSYFTCMLNVVL